MVTSAAFAVSVTYKRAAAARSVHAQAIDVEAAFRGRAAVAAHVQRSGSVDPANVLAVPALRPGTSTTRL